MIEFENMNLEVIIGAIVIYLFLIITIAKIGSYKKCGGYRALAVSLFLTPIIGIIYVMISPVKSTLKIVHYRCNNCGLEYTTKHKYCPSCYKEGVKHRLEKISMRTY